MQLFLTGAGRIIGKGFWGKRDKISVSPPYIKYIYYEYIFVFVYIRIYLTSYPETNFVIAIINWSKFLFIEPAAGVVLDSSKIADWKLRRLYIAEMVRRAIPQFFNTVCMTRADAPLIQRPLVYGPHKGAAYFWEEEFGDHVFVVLH